MTESAMFVQMREVEFDEIDNEKIKEEKKQIAVRHCCQITGNYDSRTCNRADSKHKAAGRNKTSKDATKMITPFHRR